MIRTMEYGNDSYTHCDTAKSFARWVKECGWTTIETFEHDTGVTFEELERKWFTLVGGHIYILEWTDHLGITHYINPATDPSPASIRRVLRNARQHKFI